MTLHDPTPAAALAAWRAALHAAGFAAPLPAEEVPVADACGRVLAAPLLALRPSPAVRVAAMDGIAVCAEETQDAPVVLAPAAFAEIDTGAPMPDGFDAVVRRERVVIDGAGAQVSATVAAGADVRPAGEDIPVDEPLFRAGHVIDAIDVGLAAAAGHATVPVRRRPQVAVLPTGDEVRSVDEEAAPEHILDSNGPMLAALAEADGAVAAVASRVVDDPLAIRNAVATLVAGADLVCVVAGSSRGRRDHTRTILTDLGDLVVDGVAVRPGHPVQLAVVDGTPVIGVPGYPVSAAFTYELFARPLLGDLLGGLVVRPDVEARLAERVGGHEDAECLVGVSLARDADGTLMATPGSRRAGALRSLARADGYIRIPPGDGLPAGTTAVVTRW